MTKKTVEQLLEEQNALIRKQNELLTQQRNSLQFQSQVAEGESRAARYRRTHSWLHRAFFMPPRDCR